MKKTNSQTFGQINVEQEMGTNQNLPVVQNTLKQFIRKTTLRDSLKNDGVQVKKDGGIEQIQEMKQIKEQNKFRCNICEQSYKMQMIKKFGNCLHLFCQYCMDQYITYKIKSSQQVTCPEDLCDKKLDRYSSLFFQLSRQLQIKFIKTEKFLKMVNDPNIKQCHQPNCSGTFNISQTLCSCTKCKTKYCQKCCYKQHKDACQDFHIQFLQNNFKFRQCKKCKNVIQKNNGCNHIVCRCGNNFCYLCGNNWSSSHNCSLSQFTEIVNIPNQSNRCFSISLAILKVILTFIYLLIIISILLCITPLLLTITLLVSIVYGGIKLMIQCNFGWLFNIIFSPMFLSLGIFWYFFDNLDIPFSYVVIIYQYLAIPFQYIRTMCGGQ